MTNEVLLNDTLTWKRDAELLTDKCRSDKCRSLKCFLREKCRFKKAQKCFCL